MAVAVTTIAEALDASELGVDVSDILGFPASAPFTVRVGAEWMRVTAGAGTTTWTVTRGYAGTIATEHDSGRAIFHVPDTYADLSRIKRRLRGSQDVETTDDDDILSDYIDAVQGELYTRVGLFLGPTPVTEILLDGEAAIDDGRWLHIPFGIQSLTSVEVQATTGGDWETVPATDLIRLPRVYEPRLDPNQPITGLRFKDVTTGTWTAFPYGYENVRITGTLGWPEPPRKITEIADTLVVRMFQARMTGQRDYVGSDEEGNPIVSRYLSGGDRRMLDAFRWEIQGR
jgi:hypothetical protein